MSKQNTKSKKQLMCDHCGRTFNLKANLAKHVHLHGAQQNLPRVNGLTCLKCNLVFKNKGLLMCHNVKIHDNKSSSPVNNEPSVIKNKYRHICEVCQINFYFSKDLKNHIRECHFNLVSQIPYCDLKKVNQVWFEKVFNSTTIVEMKKVAQNKLLIRKLDDNTAMKVGEYSTEVIDLHDLYPTQRSKTVHCEYCHKMYDKSYINKHITDVHLKYSDKELYKK